MRHRRRVGQPTSPPRWRSPTSRDRRPPATMSSKSSIKSVYVITGKLATFGLTKRADNPAAFLSIDVCEITGHPRTAVEARSYRPICAPPLAPQQAVAGVQAARARGECGGLTAECDVGQVASRRSGGLDSRAWAVPALPLCSCGYCGQNPEALFQSAGFWVRSPGGPPLLDTGWAGGWSPCSYFRMLIARAITSAAMTRDTAASVIISSLAHRLIAETSVGLNAVAVQKASDR
jgi:hypothetical protein